MRLRPWFAVALFLFASPLLAVDRWVAIAGSVGVFRTDARLFNPSYADTITVEARFLGPGNVSNAERIAAPGTMITLAPREMKVLDDVVLSVFSATGLGGILFTSPAEFLATARIYAQTPTGTLGQFITAPSPGLAAARGVLLHLKSNSAFRTNIGGVNNANADTTLTFKLYDKTGAVVSTKNETMPPYSVITPQNIANYFPDTAGKDLSDAWIGYSSSNPVFWYASVIDNSTTDQFFVPAQIDPATPPVQQPTLKTFNVSLEDFSIRFSPAPTGIAVGDEVKLIIRKEEGSHGFALSSPSFSTIMSFSSLPLNTATERTFTVTAPGVYQYFCTVSTCGTGHNSMVGEFTVGSSSPDGGGKPGY